MVSVVEGEAIKKGAEIIIQQAPAGIELIKSWFRGKKIMLVGPADTGKTTLKKYLCNDLFQIEHTTRHTLAPDDKGCRVTLKIGGNAPFKLYIARVSDSSGHAKPDDLADAVVQRKPHALVIVVDLSSPLPETCNWLTLFCSRIESVWSTKRGAGNRLKSIILVMNKRDKVNQECVDSAKKEFEGILNSLHWAPGHGQLSPMIHPCSLVKSQDNKNGKDLVEVVVTQLAEDLAR